MQNFGNVQSAETFHAAIENIVREQASLGQVDHPCVGPDHVHAGWLRDAGGGLLPHGVRFVGAREELVRAERMCTMIG